MAVEHGDITKAAAKSFDRLRRQADFGNQDQRLLALANDFFDCLQIDFRLAAAGNAVKRKDAKPTLADGLLDRCPGIQLVSIQLESREGRRRGPILLGKKIDASQMAPG